MLAELAFGVVGSKQKGGILRSNQYKSLIFVDYQAPTVLAEVRSLIGRVIYEK